jgi:hypothetical protein
MVQTKFDEPALKRALKEALVETLNAQRELLREVFAEVLEDFVYGGGHPRGPADQICNPREVVRALEGKR